MDWNRDGRMDVWVRNRTGPQLRFLVNDVPGEHAFVALELRGTETNRDAIGAVVELTAGDTRMIRQITAGSGYLAQSSSTVHFGLGPADTIERLTVRWPGGRAETIAPPAVNGRYRVVQGSGRAEFVTATPVTLGSVDPPRDETPPGTRMLLKTPLPLPPALLEDLGVERGRTTLVNLWAHWCEPCAAEIEAYARQSGDLDSRSIAWSPVSLDADGDREAAREWLRLRFVAADRDDPPQARFFDGRVLDTLQLVVEHVTGRADALPIPTSLLVDGSGHLQMLYLGPVFPDRFLSDAARALDPDTLASRRSLHAGRWYFRSPRNLAELSRRLIDAGRIEDARFYAERSRDEPR